MPRRFQFSLQRLLGSLSLLCLAVWLWLQSFPGRDFGPQLFNPFAFTGFAMTLAAGIGILFQRALGCAFAVYLCCVVLAFVVLLKVLWLLWLLW
ncbi:MAG: hypothetical protein ACREHD_09980 [Pirellulales bacterium]